MREDAVRKLYEDLLVAWNRRRADEYAALFADDGFAVGLSDELTEELRAQLRSNDSAFVPEG